MDKDLARSMIRTAFRAFAELQTLLALLKKQLSPEQYKERAVAIASAVDCTNQALIKPALHDFPELSREIDESIEKHGRYV